MINLLIQLLHLLIVTTLGTIMSISTNKYTLIVTLVGIGLVFLMALYFDGCIMSRYEGFFPFTNKEPNELIRSMFGLTDKDVSLNSLEKILIGLAFIFLAFKIICIIAFENIFSNTYVNQMCVFSRGSKKKWYENIFANYMG